MHALPTTRLQALAGLSFLLLNAHADSWSYDPKASDREFKFGATRIVVTTDARENRKYPDFVLRIFSDQELRAQYRGIGFEQVFASPDNELFLGLSNRGIPDTAVVLFDKKGNLRLLATHGLAEFDY